MPVKSDLEKQTFSSPMFNSVVTEATEFFNATPTHEFPPASRFSGSGVYALYYTGGFVEYARIAQKNRESLSHPIYVGKAVPKGWRTARITEATGRTLYNRLTQHARNIHDATNLRREDFKCRYMIFGKIEMELIGVVEAQLIRLHNPLWNTVVDGFGNHDPGRGRYNQAKSEWDVLHPGRSWANRLTGTAPVLHDVIRKVRQHLE
jgi:hypothetical protein